MDAIHPRRVDLEAGQVRVPHSTGKHRAEQQQKQTTDTSALLGVSQPTDWTAAVHTHTHTLLYVTLIFTAVIREQRPHHHHHSSMSSFFREVRLDR